MAGWICLYRDIQDHWIFSDAEHFRAWVDLLLLANHEDTTIMLKGQVVKLLRGQVGWSQVALASRWKWGHRDRVSRFLKKLSNEGMIELETTHLNSVITICNYCKYQDNYAPDKASGKAPDKAAGKAQTTIEQLNNENKITNLEEDKSSSCLEAKKINVFLSLPLNKKDELHDITDDEIELYRQLYPAIDVEQECIKILGWCIANPSKRKTKTGVAKFINTWLSKAQDQSGSRIQSNSPVLSKTEALTERNKRNIQSWLDKKMGAENASN